MHVRPVHRITYQFRWSTGNDRSSQVHAHAPYLFSFSPALGRYVTLSLDLSPLLQTSGLLRTQGCDKDYFAH